MRMGAFLVGGIVGAAAAIYVTRNKSFTMSGLSDNLSLNEGTMNKINNTAKNTWNGIIQAAQSTVQSVVNKSADTANKSAKSTGSKSVDSTASLDQVEKIIEKDPEVRAQVNEILAHHSKTSSSDLHA